MKNYTLVASYLLFAAADCVFVLDLVPVFNYQDISFVLFCALYTVFLYMQKAKSSLSFYIAFYFLVLMGLSYIPTAASRTTERFGEWFFVMLAYAMIQRMIELWKT